MNKKYLLITLASVSLLVIICFLIYSYFAEAQVKKDIKQTTIEAVEKWANFSDSYSEDYLSSLKPFLTEEKYKVLSKDAAKAREINSKYGVMPTGSTFTDIKITSISKEKENYIVKAEGFHKYSTDQEASSKIAEIVFVRVNNKWLISDIYFEN